MGIVERKFSEGGIYYLVRSKSHPSILRALNKELMLSIIKMEVVKLTCYCGCLFLLRPFKSFHIDIHILGACIRMMVIMYFVCLLQIYFESLFSSTVAFILIFMVGLFGIFIGDYIYYHGFSKKIILLASSNLTMHLRYLWLGINNIIIVMLMLLKILLLESILYFHLKKKDFIA
ncbi:MAG: hypothetical protein PHD70_07990 [Anaerostipes sp.]|nr:hypothetical protein [Anaerostipes sp.]MDD3746393.1 hypothetical protein [Anaerostipes sp.]